MRFITLAEKLGPSFLNIIVKSYLTIPKQSVYVCVCVCLTVYVQAPVRSSEFQSWAWTKLEDENDCVPLPQHLIPIPI